MDGHPLLGKHFELIRKRRFKKEAQLLYQNILHIAYQALPYDHNGIRVMEEEWDHLIILDACRYDVFKELNKIPGKLEKRVSLGSATPEWLRKNFTRYYEDIVYISANPHISHVKIRGFRGTDHFFKVINVWDFGWSEALNTVPPENVTKAALLAREKYPDKKLIIHYMQPHAPWIGRILLSGKELGLSHSTALDWIPHNGIWEKAFDKGISLDLIKEAYRDNLRLALNEVKKLLSGLEGKIVITSDHGECHGEKFLIEHPEGIYVKELVQVPWLIIEKPKTKPIEKRNLERT